MPSVLCLILLMLLAGCNGHAADADADSDVDAADGDADADLDADFPPCLEGMVLVEDDAGTPFCIDRYEYPGLEGMMPRVRMPWYQAREACSDEGKALCLEDQWERACVGTDEEACQGEIAPSGSRPGCVSEHGAYDMPGNVDEWTASPGMNVTFLTRGGSGDQEAIGCDLRQELVAEGRRLDLGLRCCRQPRR